MIPKRITRKFIEDQIENVRHITDSEDNKWDVCILTIANGFKVEGTAYRQFSTPHEPSVARASSYQVAFEKLWAYYTFLSHYKHNIEEVKDVEKEEEKPPFVKIGYRFHLSLHKDKIDDQGTVHILALVDGSSLAFINIYDGLRWKDPVRLSGDKLKEGVNYNDIWKELVGIDTYWKEQE